MAIYSYDFARSISNTLHLPFEEDPELSDQNLYELLIISEKSNVPGPYTAQCSKMSIEEKKAMTSAANSAKRGMKESDRSRGIKSIAQKNRWSNMTDEERRNMVKLSQEGITEKGRINQTKNAIAAFSPVRQKGFKQPLTICPHCRKEGGLFSMKRYHFERCKSK